MTTVHSKNKTPGEHPAANAAQPDARGQAVLAWIIKEHLVTGEPVGSSTVARHCASTTAWSSATIRNTMAELEDAGLVEQPHTSAGRVPTDKGYRFFVDNLLNNKTRLSQKDLSAVSRQFEVTDSTDAAPHKLMERVSHLLSHLSDSIGIVIAPQVTHNALQHIEFVSLSDRRILAVLVFVPNIVQNRLITLEEPLTQTELERTARYLNHEFNGKTLIQIRAEILRVMREEKRLYDQLARTAFMLCERSFQITDGEREEVFVDGASNIVAKPDFTDAERLRELLRTIEEKSRLIEILSECLKRGEPNAVWTDVRVQIGRENNAPAMQNCSLVTASYRIGTTGVQGTLGIVAPMRIEYARTMALVNHIARAIEKNLNADES